MLAGFAIAAAVADAGLSLVERWLSARIGEGLIYDLRVRVFDHVQRLPVAFFTRAQTGALVSRLNNDVIGAQRAVTGTLGSVVSNVVVLVTTVVRSEEHTSELQSLMRISYAVFCLTKKKIFYLIKRRVIDIHSE